MTDKRKLRSEIDSHNKRNGELARVLKEKGVGEQDEITAEYHFWVPEHEQAVAFAKRFYDLGFVVSTLSPVEHEDGVIWNVEVRKRGTAHHILSETNTTELVLLADEYGGIYDGWGTNL